jgi:hypothetical protein
MSLLALADVIIPVLTAIIAAVATTLAAVLPVWIKLREERAARQKDFGKSQKQQEVLESDIDEKENLLRNRLEELESRIAQLESHLAEAPSRPTISNDSGPSAPAPPPIRPAAPVKMTGTGDLRGRDKRAYLVGAVPKGKSVQWLVKVHDFKGKSIYVYDLLSGAWGREADSSTPDIDAEIARYGEIGHEIDHLSIRLNGVSEWITHAQGEVRKEGLTIEKQPSSPLRSTPVPPS